MTASRRRSATRYPESQRSLWASDIETVWHGLASGEVSTRRLIALTGLGELRVKRARLVLVKAGAVKRIRARRTDWSPGGVALLWSRIDGDAAEAAMRRAVRAAEWRARTRQAGRRPQLHAVKTTAAMRRGNVGVSALLMWEATEHRRTLRGLPFALVRFVVAQSSLGDWEKLKDRRGGLRYALLERLRKATAEVTPETSALLLGTRDSTWLWLIGCGRWLGRVHQRKARRLSDADILGLIAAQPRRVARADLVVPYLGPTPKIRTRSPRRRGEREEVGMGLMTKIPVADA